MITNNSDEYSKTITRSDGSRVDFCTFKGERDLTIGITFGEGDIYREITLTPAEIYSMLTHLNDPITQGILGGV